MSKRKSLEYFVNIANEIHDDKYFNYSLIYKNDRTYLGMECPFHGHFEQLTYNHIYNKQGCFQCKIEEQTLTTKEFIEKANIIHNNLYSYNFTNYINNKTPVIITCEKHGNFPQLPSNHLSYRGCPTCNKSKNEIEISNILTELNIIYIEQKTFEFCKNKDLLRFDFYLPEYNSCIEYDGELHFIAYDYYGGIDKLNSIKLNDNIKNNYCSDNNIELLRIFYLEQKMKKNLIINFIYKISKKVI